MKNLKNMDIKNLKGLKKSAEEFLDSDNGYATATKVAMAMLLFAGFLTITAVAPNVFSAFGKRKRFRGYSNKQMKTAFYGLKRKGLVEFIKESNDDITVKLNYAKKEKIKKFSFDTLSIYRPEKWDKRWHVVIFDIPVKFNKARRAMTIKLKELGFYQLQRSVWAYPFPCEDEVLFVAAIFNVERFIDILLVERMFNDYKLRNFFDL